MLLMNSAPTKGGVEAGSWRRTRGAIGYVLYICAVGDLDTRGTH